MAILAAIVARVVLIGGRTAETGGVPALALTNAGSPLLHSGLYLTQ